jgi:hypothetical protein
MKLLPLILLLLPATGYSEEQMAPLREPSTQTANTPAPASVSPAQPAALANTRPEARGSMNDRLAQLLLEAEPQLGKLEPWQKQLFEEEAVPQAQRFVKNYTGSTAEFDFDGIKNYIRFHAPEVLRRIDGKVLGLLKVDPSCSKCADAKDAIKVMMSERVRRRGLEVTWLATEDLTSESLSERELEDRLVTQVGSQPEGPAGALSVHLRAAPVDDIDTAHADDKRLQVLTFLYVKDASGHELSKSQGKLEVFDTEPLNTVTARLLTDAFTDLGARQKKMEQDIATSGKAEVEIEVSGIRNYELYSKVQRALATSLKDEGAIEPRKISRGRAVFALTTSKSADKIRNQLLNVRTDQETLTIRGISDQQIHMELK